MIILTSGKKYIDIDAYASCIAYRELLCMQGIDAKFVSNSNINYSVTESLKKLPFTMDNYAPADNDQFIILDVSNKDFFADYVAQDKIIEIIDHHPGYEEYWTNVIGNKATIESIGSVATIIVEKYEKYGFLDRMDKSVAKLLMAAILDNTLNFTAKITSDRDKNAYQKLQAISEIQNFDQVYFSECQARIEKNLADSILNDVKVETVNEYLPKTLGQLTIWSIDSILKMLDVVTQTMNTFGSEWLINIIALKDKKSYIFCSDNQVKEQISLLFNESMENERLVIVPITLRKEIIKRAIEKKLKTR